MVVVRKFGFLTDVYSGAVLAATKLSQVERAFKTSAYEYSGSYGPTVSRLPNFVVVKVQHQEIRRALAMT